VKDPTIWCIVPFSRPKYIHRIFESFKAQTYFNKKLVIVENGKGIGTCKAHNLQPDLLLSSGPHQSWAKNEGILKLRALGYGNDFWSTWDDDDYYGPKFLEELAANVHKADVIGKAKSFIKLTDGRLYLIAKPPENSLVTSAIIHGPTITAKVGESLLFEHLPFAEDLKFVDQMREQGATFYVTSRYNWCYMRNENAEHTWQIGDDEFRFANSGSFIDYGPFDKDVVNGTIQKPGKVVYCESVNLRNSFTYKEVIKHTGGTPDEVMNGIAQKLFGDPNEKKVTSI
jgi:glycosyltransferase involved in cell wall biosynthesis